MIGPPCVVTVLAEVLGANPAGLNAEPGLAAGRFVRDSSLAGDEFEPSVPSHSEFCCRALALGCLAVGVERAPRFSAIFSARRAIP